jgi:hypothetical protein
MTGRTLPFLVAAVLSQLACGSSGGGGPADAASGNPSSCPADLPGNSTACTAPLTCDYGHSTCCGVDYSQFRCKCQTGTFACSQTVECNMICPEAGPQDAQAGSG